MLNLFILKQRMSHKCEKIIDTEETSTNIFTYINLMSCDLLRTVMEIVHIISYVCYQKSFGK